ncbi:MULTISPECIES: N-succinylarginine dihydrolase [unclassified Vibrio]|uniref:N-succinylarginine dihydrolase n=1 Tax=Vibrio sp. HB236076 TaxID=3232307 RepID=A0AB39HIB5_9VIBR|nr:N-succinylarginine dihydrolase [Vibrio sp. HB161653]MDP5252676.1 N-succinylarginine dihydrolase [Vibrio sp. HB161653]
MSTEANFDGLVGPTHHYAGLSHGNIASTANVRAVSNPKLAALQGLKKMKALHDMGYVQGILPPQERPCIEVLNQLGFSANNDASLLAKVHKFHPQLLSAVSSASSMWVANAATVSPSADTRDGKVHFSVANLNNKFHRSIEAKATEAALKATFNDSNHFVIHSALPQQALFGDEGAANHNRLSVDDRQPGVEVFVYGRSQTQPGPRHYPARQTLEACRSIAYRHGLLEDDTLFLQQNPDVIDQGVFHNDVISVTNGPVWFYHQEAFVDQTSVFSTIEQRLAKQGSKFQPIEVPTEAVSVQDAVESYLFNSQLLSKANGRMLLLVPAETQANRNVAAYLQHLTASSDCIDQVMVMDLRESMRNGGGPACLRLRVVLTEQERMAMNPSSIMNNEQYQRLVNWVEKHYRDRLSEEDLLDPQLLEENRVALDQLTQILNLGSLYPFQQNGNKSKS